MSNIPGWTPNGGTSMIPQQTPADDPNRQQQQQQQQQNNNNNDSPNDDDMATMWEAPKDEPTNDNPQQTQQQNQQQQQRTPAETLREHITGLNLIESVDANALWEAAQSGDAAQYSKVLTEQLEGIAAKTYMSAVKDTSRVVDAKIEQAVAQAVEKATGAVATDRAVEALHNALPFTKDPMIATVAKGVMGQFLKKGASQEQAIAKTREFFKRTNQITSKELGGPPNPSPGHRGFNNAPAFSDNGNGNDNEDFSWVESLSQ